MAAVRDAVDAGELAVPVPAEAPLSGFGAGSYGTPLALRLAALQTRPPAERSRDVPSPARSVRTTREHMPTSASEAHKVAEVIARRMAGRPGVREVRVEGPGFLTVVVERPGTLATEILRNEKTYARAEGVPHGSWPDRPRTFANPGFAVRYAYARAVAVQREAARLGIPLGDPQLLMEADEHALLALLAELPSRVGQAVREMDATPLRRHLERVADAYHRVHEHCPALPKGDEKPGATHAARRTLAEAVRVAVANALNTIGESPRERI